MQIYFCIEKNSDLHLKKMQICFCIEKNLDLYQEKMQIYFILIKKIINMQIINIQERDYNNHIKKQSCCKENNN